MGIKTMKYQYDRGQIDMNVIENLLRDIIFSSTSNEKCLADFLYILPCDSKIWEDLERGFSEDKYIPERILAVLCLKKPSFLEREILSLIFSKYANDNSASKCNGAQQWLTIVSLGLSQQSVFLLILD